MRALPVRWLWWRAKNSGCCCSRCRGGGCGTCRMTPVRVDAAKLVCVG